MAKDPSVVFRESWSKADEYPLSLIKLGPNIGTLRAHKKLLDVNAVTTFYSKSKIPILEFHKDPKIPVPHLIEEESELLKWLVVPPVTPNSTPSAPLPSGAISSLPKGNASPNAVSNATNTGAAPPNASSPAAAVSNIRCRFIFFTSPTNESKLAVNVRMASQILTYFQVMSSFVAFIPVLKVNSAGRVEGVELRFSGFREKVLLSQAAHGLQLPVLALTGRNYQLCYNLKCISIKSESARKEDWLWSARQGSFHHQFDVGEGTALWIITSARKELENRVKELTGDEGREVDKNFGSKADSFVSSLAVHLMLAQWATEDWRGYIRWLEQVLEEKTIDVLRSAEFVPSSSDISFIQNKEDETNKAIMMLDANAEILDLLHNFYQDLFKNQNFELRNNDKCQTAVADFLLELRDFSKEFKMHAARAKTLGKITADRKNLVQQHLQTHSTKQMQALTEQSQREAINMRVIAIVTFILLPATFVSTLFSTDIVKYQDGYESYSALALQRWFEVTLPLTLVTFAFAGCLLYWHTVKSFPGWILGGIARCVRRKHGKAKIGHGAHKV